MESLYQEQESSCKRISKIIYKNLQYKVITKVNNLYKNKILLYSLYRGTNIIAECEVVDYFKKYDILNNLNYNNLPNHFIKLIFIMVNSNYKAKGYGSLLLNLVIQDVINYSKNINENLSILFTSFSNPEALNFYKGFNAKIFDKNSYTHMYPMIIENPQIKTKHAFKYLNEKYLLQKNAELQL